LDFAEKNDEEERKNAAESEHLGVTRVLQECYKSATMLFEGKVFKSVT
jgi:hypothetical protein